MTLLTLHEQQSQFRQQLQFLAPKYFLPLNIFGSCDTKRRVTAELDRRAAHRLSHTLDTQQVNLLQPAA